MLCYVTPVSGGIYRGGQMDKCPAQPFRSWFRTAEQPGEVAAAAAECRVYAIPGVTAWRGSEESTTEQRHVRPGRNSYTAWRRYPSHGSTLADFTSTQRARLSSIGQLRPVENIFE